MSGIQQVPDAPCQQGKSSDNHKDRQPLKDRFHDSSFDSLERFHSGGDRLQYRAFCRQNLHKALRLHFHP